MTAAVTTALPKSSSNVGWGERAIMLVGGIPTALALIALASVLPKIDAALAHSPDDSFLVKQLIGAVGLAMAVGAPAAGFIVLRVGLRNLLVGALILYVVAGTAGLYVNDLPVLLATRLCLGLAGAAIQIMAMSLINVRLGEAERATWMGRHIAFAMIGTIFLHPLAGMLGDISWRGPFLLYATGLLLLPAALQARRSLIDDTSVSKALSTAATGTSPALTPKKASIFKSNFPWHYLALAVVLGGIAYLPMVYAPYLLRQHGISSSTVMSLVLTADSLAGACMALLYGRARRRLSHYQAFAVCLGFAGCGALLAATATGVIAVIVGLLFYGIGVGWFTPNLMTALGVKVPAYHQASAAGLVKAAFFISSPLFIALAEPVARQYGPAGTMFMMVTLAFSLCVVFLLRHRARNINNSRLALTVDI